MIDSLPAGTMLENRYRILRLLGQGGMGRVYLAEHTRLGVRVAIKENLQTGSAAQSQFWQEARILAGLSHPNLPRVSDHFVDADTGRQYLVMEYVEGDDLEHIIERQGHLAEATALAWIRQVMDALEYLHSQRPPVIHRDVKPGNIKITPQGKAVLVDFGISKVYEPGMPTLTGAQALAPGYAPPEQYGMRTNERSDIYSLGATLYTMLTGRQPPASPVLMVKAEKLVPPRAIVRDISSHVESAVLKAMEPETTKRWPSLRAFRMALIPGARRPQARVLAGRPWVLWAGAGLLVAGLLAVILVPPLLRGNGGNPNTPTPVVTTVPTSTISDAFIPERATDTPVPPTPTIQPTATLTAATVIPGPTDTVVLTATPTGTATVVASATATMATATGTSTSTPTVTGTPTPPPTHTPVPSPTHTPVPSPTNTPVPPTSTPTPVPPTPTPVPPTPTPVPPTPTDTPIPPTNTPVPPPTDTPVPTPTYTPPPLPEPTDTPPPLPP